jgi:hypothetical protein
VEPIDCIDYSRARCRCCRSEGNARDAPLFLCRNAELKQPAASVRLITTSFDRGRRSFEFVCRGTDRFHRCRVARPPAASRLSLWRPLLSIVVLSNRRFLHSRISKTILIKSYFNLSDYVMNRSVVVESCGWLDWLGDSLAPDIPKRNTRTRKPSRHITACRTPCLLVGALLARNNSEETSPRPSNSRTRKPSRRITTCRTPCLLVGALLARKHSSSTSSRSAGGLARRGLLRVFPSSSGPFSSASRPPRCDSTRRLFFSHGSYSASARSPQSYSELVGPLLVGSRLRAVLRLVGYFSRTGVILSTCCR